MTEAQPIEAATEFPLVLRRVERNRRRYLVGFCASEWFWSNDVDQALRIALPTYAIDLASRMREPVKAAFYYQERAK